MIRRFYIVTDRERNFRCIVFKWPPDRYGRTQTSYRNVADQKRVLWDDSLDGDTGLRTQQRKSITFCIGTHGIRNLGWGRVSITQSSWHGDFKLTKSVRYYRRVELSFSNRHRAGSAQREITFSHFYRAAYIQGGLRHSKRVRPSVRHTRELWQNERKFSRDSYTVWKVNSYSFSDTKNGWWGTPPSTWKFWSNWPTSFKNGDCQSTFAHTASARTSSEKSSIMTNRKSLWAFQWA